MNNGYVKFKNDQGVAEIGTGVKEFKCAGAAPPHDHPHVYLNMGGRLNLLSLLRHEVHVNRPHLGRHETEPPGNLFED